MINQSRQSLLGTLLIVNNLFFECAYIIFQILTLEGAAIAHTVDSHTLAEGLSICNWETVVGHILQAL
jgi:hypothetical protein